MPPVEHPAFEDMVDTVGRAGARVAYLMIPKPRGLADLQRAVDAVDAQPRGRPGARDPLQALVETHGALREVQALAAHPRIESLSFGLMDFVSAHRGAIPASAMGVSGQFEHPLVLRAVGDRRRPPCLRQDAVALRGHRVQGRAGAAARGRNRRAQARLHTHVEHPPGAGAGDRRRFAPSTAEVDLAIEILLAAQAAGWAPIRHRDTLHDRASHRYFWQLLQRAHRTSYAGGAQLPAEVLQAFFDEGVA